MSLKKKNRKAPGKKKTRSKKDSKLQRILFEAAKRENKEYMKTHPSPLSQL